MSQIIDFAALSWLDVERRLCEDKRIVLPLGATEEHAHLSLATDTLFVDHVTRAACLRAGVLRAPVLPFGCSAFATNFPGTVSLRTETLCRLVEDMVDCLYRQGFRRLVFVSGHGGNEVVTGVLAEVQIDRPQLAVYFRDGWSGMKEAVARTEAERDLPKTEHAGWHEVFPFTVVGEIPDRAKRFPEHPDFPPFPLNPRTARKYLGEGVESGKFDLRDPELMMELLASCVDDVARFLGGIPLNAPQE